MSTESVTKLLQDSRELREECRERRGRLRRDLLQSTAAANDITRSVRGDAAEKQLTEALTLTNKRFASRL